jgi:hypothetical protein
MSERLNEALIDDLEITMDFFGSLSVQNVYFGELKDRRQDLVDRLIDTGDDEFRFKIQMLDEVFSISEEIEEEFKTRKNEDE